MKRKNTLVIKLIIIAIIAIAFFGFGKVTAAAEEEKVVSETTTLQWVGQSIEYNMPLKDYSIVYYAKSNLQFTKTSTVYSGLDNSELPSTVQFIHEGDTIKYVITAQNLGLGTEKNITITDDISLNLLDYVETIPTGGGQTTTNINGNIMQVTWNRRYCSICYYYYRNCGKSKSFISFSKQFYN